MKLESKIISRRAFGGLLAAGVAGAAQQPPSREEELRAARKRQASAIKKLAGFDLPMATEPAFLFRP